MDVAWLFFIFDADRSLMVGVVLHGVKRKSCRDPIQKKSLLGAFLLGLARLHLERAMQHHAGH